MTRTTPLLTAAALGLALGASACDHEQVNRPFGNVAIDPLFERYVSMGNSITAGFQSGGINDSTQLQSYAVLLARAVRSPFQAPLLNRPGCPPPFTNVFTQERVGGGTPTTCALRAVPNNPLPFVSNTAVPGAQVIDIYNNLDAASSANALTTFILGGLTQVQMARRANPTFATVWIGNNDVLGAAIDDADAGDTTLITPAATFAQRYEAMLDSLDEIGPVGGVLIGVGDVTLIPFFSRGSVYWAIKNTPPSPFPATFTVDNNCAPSAAMIPGARGDTTLVPFPYGFTLLAQAAAGLPAVLSCADNVPQVIVPAELRALVTAVVAYNGTIAAAATARGWPFLDPSQLFSALPPGAIPLFPNSTGADAITRPFGDYFSRDGIHPSALLHRLIANALATTINAAYGTSIPPIP